MWNDRVKSPGRGTNYHKCVSKGIESAKLMESRYSLIMRWCLFGDVENKRSWANSMLYALLTGWEVSIQRSFPKLEPELEGSVNGMSQRGAETRRDNFVWAVPCCLFN